MTMKIKLKNKLHNHDDTTYHVEWNRRK